MRRSILAVFLLTIMVNACQTYVGGLQQSIARANETAALTTLKTIGLAQQTYSLTNNGEYGTLKQLSDGGFLDVRYAGEKPVKDYVVSCNVIAKAAGAPAGSFSCNADPDKGKESAGRHLYIDSTSDGIHVNDTQPATAADNVMQ
jgi:Tfp pilus assembly protein PilE